MAVILRVLSQRLPSVRTRANFSVGRVVYHPLAPLVFYSAALAALLIIYMTAGSSPSPGFRVAASAGWTIMAVLAIVNDARRRRLVPCYDFGLYCWVSFP